MTQRRRSAGSAATGFGCSSSNGQNGADCSWISTATTSTPGAPELSGVIDVTGAGDAFAGGFLAGWLRDGDIARSIAQGVVSASLAIEDWGCRGLDRATPQQAQERLAGWFPELTTAETPQQVPR